MTKLEHQGFAVYFENGVEIVLGSKRTPSTLTMKRRKLKSDEAKVASRNLIQHLKLSFDWNWAQAFEKTPGRR